MKKDVYILGISAAFNSVVHNVAAALIKNSEIVAAVEEERLIRIKHADGRFPKKAINFCLSNAGIGIKDVDYLVFHVNTYKDIINDITDYMNFHFGYCPKIKLVDHHTAHAATAYFLSGFKEAKILTIDYSGDGISTTLNYGKNGKITRLKDYRRPNSLGIFYAIITQFLGFQLNSDEYKVMGLSAYGNHNSEMQNKIERMLSVSDVSFDFNTSLFKDTRTMYQPRYSDKLYDILGKNRKTDEPITQREKDIAYAAQRQFEKACLALLKDLSGLVESRNFCLAGGSALNCVMASELLHSGYVDNMFIPPAADDPGTSIGAALVVASQMGFCFEGLKSPFLGPEYRNEQIKEDLDTLKLKYKYLNENELLDYVARKILEGKIIGWFQNKLEFGARARGNRSILANPQDPSMKDKINKYIKFRESFRPFAPSLVLLEAMACGLDIVVNENEILPPSKYGICKIDGKLARKIALKFDWKHVAERHINIYKKIFDEKHSKDGTKIKTKQL